MFHTNSSCEEYSRISRRKFLGAAAAAGGAPVVLPRMAFASGGGTPRPTLVGIFLRGAIDGLSFVVPYGDSDLYAARPGLAVAPPGATDGAVDLDGFFGLNPNAADLIPAYQSGALAFVQACGSTDPSRSHFSAMRTMETGTPDDPQSNEVSGWLARHLQSVSPTGAGDLRAISVDDLVPRVLALARRRPPNAPPLPRRRPGCACLGAAPRRRTALPGSTVPITCSVNTGIDPLVVSPPTSATLCASASSNRTAALTHEISGTHLRI